MKFHFPPKLNAPTLSLSEVCPTVPKSPSGVLHRSFTGVPPPAPLSLPLAPDRRPNRPPASFTGVPPAAPLSLPLAPVPVVPVPPVTLFLSLKLLNGVCILLNMLWFAYQKKNLGQTFSICLFVLEDFSFSTLLDDGTQGSFTRTEGNKLLGRW